MMVSMRLFIYKKMFITLLIAIFAIIQSVECNSEKSNGVALLTSNGTAPNVNTTFADSWKAIASREPKQIVDFFARDDVEKFLISLRTFLMGVRNFAEALGGFVPNNEHIKEKNAMISRYSGIFNTVRVVSNAVQYVTKFLEDLVIRELDQNRQNKRLSRQLPLSTIMKPFNGAFQTIRGVAASVLGAYLYYSPEIHYTRCLGQFVRKEYPEMLPKVILPNTFRALKATYEYAANFISMIMSPFHQITNSVETSYSEFDENQLENEIDQNIEAPLVTVQEPLTYIQQQPLMTPVDYQKHLSVLYNMNQGDISRRNIAQLNHRIGIAQRSTGSFLYSGPRQLDNVDLPTGFDESSTTENSIFNFDNTMAEQLGVQEEPGVEEENKITFGKCTQNYALDILWRLMEKLILS